MVNLMLTDAITDVRRRMDAARDLEEIRRQQQAAEQARGVAGGLLDWLKNK